MNRILCALITLLALFFPAVAQEKAQECTKEYVQELDEEALANADMRRWTTDYLRPACKAVQRTEEIAGKILTPLGGKWLWDRTLGDYVDPQLSSKTCKYIRKLGEQILTPDEDAERIKKELERCKTARQ